MITKVEDRKYENDPMGRIICNKCGKPTTVLLSNTKPEASEAACIPCKKSYELTPQELGRAMSMRRGQPGAG